MQVKCFAGNLVVDVGKKIFIRRDTESRRSTFPFDLERAAGIDVRKGADRAFICLDTAVASNPDPVASGDQSNACDKKYDRDLLHGKSVSWLIRCSNAPLRIQEFAAYFTIFSFTVPTKTSST